jgi:hypothetical protein
MDVLLSFAAALVALRLAGALVARRRTAGRAELGVWAASLASYALAAAALAWGAAHGWDARAFRAYYLFGGFLTAPLLGAGSLLLVGRRFALPLVLVYAGLAAGVAIAVPVHGHFGGTAVPAAQDHLALLPARLVAIVANSLGAVVVIGIALGTLRRRPLGNLLIVAGVAVASVGSAFGSLGSAGAAISIAASVVLLYCGFVAPQRLTDLRPPRSRLADLTSTTPGRR